MENNPETKLLDIGLDPKLAKETVKNQKICNSLLNLLTELRINKCDKKIGNLLYTIASTVPDYYENQKAFLGKYVVEEKINSVHKLTLAVEFIKKHQNFQAVDMEKACGVGVETSEEEVKKTISEFLASKESELSELKYAINITAYLKALRDALPFAEQAFVVKAFNKALEDRLGPRVKEEGKKKPEVKKVETKAEKKDEEAEEERPKKRIECLVARDLQSCLNTEELLKKHHEFTGGKIMTRFPPEPNGYLHIGHAKAMRFSFMTAKENGGECYLRFDDTNPEKETKEYIDNIHENVHWLGYKPWKVTYASDNFEKLYEYAIVLIKKGLAYVCFMESEKMREFRKEGKPSPWRDAAVEDNLKHFEAMRKGLYSEGEACLRLKIDINHVNPTMRDPVAYRIRYTPHPHAGDKWCIYPCYDYTHCICDSLENITHSLCTLEFEIRRDLYYWVLQVLDIYRPNVWEYSRLNVTFNLLSKRKLLKMVESKIVNGWDDPRMLTINGLRRRGYTNSAINDFCDLVSVTRRGNENFIEIGLLQHCVRKDLDSRAKRTMAVLHPIKLTIENVPTDFCKLIDVPFFPKDPSKGSHQIRFTKEVFVEAADVKAEDVKGFFGISPGKAVMLKYASPLLIKAVDLSGDCPSVKADLIEDPNFKVPKGVLHWISVSEATDCEVRLYENLFTVPNPNELPNFLDALNPNSLTVIKAKVQKNLLCNLNNQCHFQFERLGFFIPDKDSDFEACKIIFNRTITLDEKEKKKVMG